MNEALLIFAGFVAHAWIGKISGPPNSVNAFGWVFGLFLTVIAVYLVLTHLGIFHG